MKSVLQTNVVNTLSTLQYKRVDLFCYCNMYVVNCLVMILVRDPSSEVSVYRQGEVNRRDTPGKIFLDFRKFFDASCFDLGI